MEAEAAAQAPATSTARRTYTSARRAAQAAQTRAAVLQAATARFEASGWSGTSMRDVARLAGVSVETIYAGVGSKVDLLQAVVDVAVVGDDEAVALADRPVFSALGVGPFEQRVRAAAVLVTQTNSRTARLARAWREAARLEPDLAALLHLREQRRRLDVRQGAQLVAAGEVEEQLVDGLWAALAHEPYLLLLEEGGWDDAKYQQWVERLMAGLLRPPDTPESSSSAPRGTHDEQ